MLGLTTVGKIYKPALTGLALISSLFSPCTETGFNSAFFNNFIKLGFANFLLSLAR
jgi:hypothetical protein